MSAYPRGDRALIRALNRSTVLNTVKNYGPVSRTEIAERTGLSVATISGITAELIESNFVFEKETGTSRGGRRPILLALNAKGGYVIGLKLAEDHITGALTDLEATVIASHTHAMKKKTAESAVEGLAYTVKELLAQRGIRRDQLIGVGVGLAGVIDTRNRVLRHSPIFGWREVSLGEMLEQRLKVPVYIDNDVNTLTQAEQWFGVGQGVDNFVVVTIGRGVGMGMVVNGQIYRGAHGGSGELGHTVLDPTGNVCNCGKRGCLETYVSDPALLRQAVPSIPGVSLLEDLSEKAIGGNELALDIFTKAGEALARGIGNLINVLSPELIIISGEGVRSGDVLFDPMRAALSKYVMPGLSEDTEVRIDDWDDDAWARGAASLVLSEIFESPLVREGAL